jgi:bifunctional DNA-binding transcriptional regulator/antitoxin component of YhaV-PrlF toxin-antitoxin module
MSIIKITTKRQATLPVELCRELGVRPGDELRIEKKFVRGERVWTLQPNSPPDSWFGSLRKYARGKSHSPESIRKSIGKGLAREKGR